MRHLIFIIAFSICTVAASQESEDSASVYFNHDDFLVVSFGSETPLSKNEVRLFRSLVNLDYQDTLKMNPTDTSITETLEPRIRTFIDSCAPDYSSCKSIQSIFTNYDRQYFFYSVNGHPYVLVSFIFQSYEWKHNTYRPRFISDGEYYYWRITLDLKSNNLIKFEINGKA